MGLLDQVIGGVLGNVLGGGNSQAGQGRGPGGGSGGGLGDILGGAASSPLVKALLMLLAAKAASGGFGDIFGRADTGRAPQAPEPAPSPGGSFSGDNPFRGGREAPSSGDGYSDLAGAFDKPGAVANDRYPGAAPSPGLDQESAPGRFEGGGLGGLIESFQRGGLGDVIGSWIGHGDNRPVAPNQLAQALGPDTVDTLARRTGMNRDDLLAQLARVLPGVVDKLTPAGRVPSPEETRHW